MTKFLSSTFVFLALLVSGNFSLAAKPTPQVELKPTTVDIINLPAENRKMVLGGEQGAKLYPEFQAVAFNETQPMSLRWRAIMAMAEAKKQEALPDLLKAGQNNSWYMRNAALVALKEIHPAEAELMARRLLKDKALVVRSAAVEALRTNTSADVRDILWEELNQSYNFKNKSSLWIRAQIVDVLSVKPKNHELTMFSNLLNDKDDRLQLPAVRGLERLTGVKLGEGKMKQSALISLWKNYIKKENIQL
jgi:FOG: HEAT repeat